MSDGGRAYAAHVQQLLWPPPWQHRKTRAGSRSSPAGSRDVLVFPSAARPRLLLPAEVPAAGVSLRRLGKGRTPAARWLTSALVSATTSGVLRRTGWPAMRVTCPDPAADSMERHLGELLSTEVRLGVVLGTPRANRKPVLQVWSVAGDLLAYVKVGHTPSTAGLVSAETRTLLRLSTGPALGFDVPAVLHSGSWRDLTLLVLTPLSGAPGRDVPDTARWAAMRDLAAQGASGHRPLADSGFWTRLRADIDAVPDPVLRSELVRSHELVGTRHAGTVLALGAWHGDWGHWNMALGADGRIRLWDWERFDPEVPVGFDELHFQAQQVRPGSRSFPERQRHFLADLPGMLTPVGVPPHQARLVLVLYLLGMTTRYAHGLCTAPTPALRRRHAWTSGVLAELVRTSHHVTSGDIA